MFKYILLLVAITTIGTAQAYTLKISIKDIDTNLPLNGVTSTIQAQSLTAYSNAEGIITFENLPEAMYARCLSLEGYELENKTIHVPLKTAGNGLHEKHCRRNG
jgi:iron complex outermembrane receptor protein